MKVVSAYRPIELYMAYHIELARQGFDWIEASRMLAHSAKVRSGVDTYVITDAPLPVPCHVFKTREEKLMLWILEVSLAYLESDDFDQNTVFISPDSLVVGSLDLFGDFDLGVSAWDSRRHSRWMNGLQWWPVAAKAGLVRLYAEAFEIAKALPVEDQRWGADTIPLVQLLGPMESPGLFLRDGLSVRFFPAGTLSTVGPLQMRKGSLPRALSTVVVDFKDKNKGHMVEYYEKEFIHGHT